MPQVFISFDITFLLIYKFYKIFKRKHPNLEPKADQSHDNIVYDLEAVVTQNVLLKLVSESNLLADVLLEILDSVETHHKPELERSEPSAERNLPVLKKITRTLVIKDF